MLIPPSELSGDDRGRAGALFEGQGPKAILGRTPSVRIIRASRSYPLSHEYWSHFRIGPADLRALLAVNGYTPTPHIDGNSDFSSLGPPAWWDPRTLGPGTLCYKCHDEEHDEEWLWTKTILINATGDEAYAVQVYPY